MMSRGKRISEQKLRVFLEGMSGTMDISHLCQREGIHPSQFYQWKRQLISGASWRKDRKCSQEKRLLT